MAQRLKISRKELLKEPDQFLSSSEQILLFVTDNQKSLVWGSVAIVLIIGGFFGFKYNQKVTDLRMETLYFDMTQIAEKGQDGNPGEANEKMKQYLDRFTDGSQKLRAKLFLANSYFDNKQYGPAINYFSEVASQAKPGSLPGQLAEVGLGHAYEGRKDYGKAIEAFKTFIDKSGGYPLFEVFLSLSRCYELNNDSHNALLILRQMKNKFIGHTQMELVDQKINKLSANA